MKKEVHVIDSSHEVVGKSNVWLVYTKDRGVALFKRTTCSYLPPLLSRFVI